MIVINGKSYEDNKTYFIFGNYEITQNDKKTRIISIYKL